MQISKFAPRCLEIEEKVRLFADLGVADAKIL